MVTFKFILMMIMLIKISAGRCPRGFAFWYQHGQGPAKPSCYKFVRTDMDWLEAKKNCLRHEGDLVSIETAGENQHLTSVIQRYSYLQNSDLVKTGSWGYWTSGNDLLREGDWRWASRNARLSFRNWSPGEPNNDDSILAGSENCLELRRALNWRWNDVPCYIMFKGSICETKGF